NSQNSLVKHWLSARFYKTKGGRASNQDNISLHSRRVNTLPRIYYKSFQDLLAVSNRYKFTNAFRPEQHFFSNKKLTHNSISFSLSELCNIREWLYKCKVSKILREKVLHMFVNFNDGVQDPLLFIYFIELRRFLEVVRDFIEQQSDPK